MCEIKGYRFCFDRWAFALFALIMLPNIIWFALLARPLDVLNMQNVLPAADTTASIARVLMIACLCFLKNAAALPIRLRGLIRVCALCVLAYYVMWALYFFNVNVQGIAYGLRITPAVCGLCIFPCAATILFSLDRKNLPALAFALVFTVCHALCTGAALLASWNGFIVAFNP